MRRRCRAFAAGVLGTLLATLASAAPDRAVLVISDGSEPYAAARSGFEAAWRDPALPLEVHVLGERDPAAALVARLAENPPSLLVTLGTPAAREVGAALPAVPWVAGLVADPAVVGDHPRASVLVTDFPVATQVEWMQRLLPGRHTVGVVYSAANEANVREAEVAFRKAGLTLVAEAVATPNELPLALRNLRQRADLIWGLPDPIVVSPETAKALLLFSFQNRIPLAGLSASWVRAGALYALERDYTDVGAQCAELARTAQRRTAGVAVRESPRRVRFALNLRTADHMRVEFRDELRREASQTFE